MHWDDRGRTELSCLLVKDAEAEEELAYEGIERIEFHDISMFSMMEIAGFMMARTSIAAYGPEVCCALILRGMFSFGCREPAQGSNYAERDIEERFSSEVIDRNIERLTAMLKAEYYPLYGAHAET